MPAAEGEIPKTILVVDDDARNRALMAACLVPEFRVIEAEDGRQAIEAVARGGVDLVLLDVMMPQLSGFDACREIKARAGGARGFLPVVLLTALSDQEDRNRGLAAGADEFLSKPVDRRELLLRVRGLLRIRDQEAQIRRHVAELRRLQALKDDLVALIVHDVRNPLAGVEGYLQLILRNLDRGPDLAALRDDVGKALEASRRLKEILEDVLRARLLEEGDLTMRRERCSLAEIAREAIETLRGAAAAGGVGVELVAEDEAPALVDRALVRRAIENLLANAIKHSRAGTAVSVAVREHGGDWALEVADRGPGIPDEIKPTLFGKFSSVEAKQGGARRGFGLGLYLVQLVARAHGGNVSADDRAGGGTVFRMTLPREIAAAARTPA